MASDEALQANAADLFGTVGSGAVKIKVNQTYALADVAKAHKALEGRIKNNRLNSIITLARREPTSYGNVFDVDHSL